MKRFYLHEVIKRFIGVIFYCAVFMSFKIIQPQILCINHAWMIANWKQIGRKPLSRFRRNVLGKMWSKVV